MIYGTDFTVYCVREILVIALEIAFKKSEGALGADFLEAYKKYPLKLLSSAAPRSGAKKIWADF